VKGKEEPDRSSSFEKIGNTVNKYRKNSRVTHDRRYIVNYRLDDDNASGVNEMLIAFGARACILRNIAVIDQQISKMCYVFGNVLHYAYSENAFLRLTLLFVRSQFSQMIFLRIIINEIKSLNYAMESYLINYGYYTKT